MEKKKEIFEEIGKPSYGVPEGYFDALKARLRTIPQKGQDGSAVPVGIWDHVKPYVALAACFLIAVYAGNLILDKTSEKAPSDQYYSDLFCSDMIPVTQPDAIFAPEETSQESITDEDIVSYLVESGISQEKLAYIVNTDK